jgi:hypothetical protein
MHHDNHEKPPSITITFNNWRLTMANPTDYDLLKSINANLETLINTGVKVDLTQVLTMLTNLQTTANSILADEEPSPAQLPIVTAISPNAGPIAGGTVVTITGSNFTGSGSTGATFGGVAGTAYSVTNDTTAVVTSPANTAGVDDVVVVSPNGNSATSPADQFTYS